MGPYPVRSIEKILIANRGEIALRLIRSVHSLGLESVAVYTDADATALHVQTATEAVSLGSDNSAYNNANSLLEAAKKSGSNAVLPGYGFISENAEAAELFENSGVTWIGPLPEHITSFADKTEARKLADKNGVPTVPGSDSLSISDEETAHKFCEGIGYPVLIKAANGGGGMGQSIVNKKEEVVPSLREVTKQAETLFGGGGVFAEKLVKNARHVEVQIFGDGEGGIEVLGLRDCSIQRRRQKVVEEAPPPNLPMEVYEQMAAASIKLCGSQNYRSAGTVEFVLDSDTSVFYFLEVNTRLQVEHCITELTTGIDIVNWMIEQALGKEIPKEIPPEKGFSIQARIYAENPAKDFLPSAGILSEMVWPKPYNSGGTTVRVDSWAVKGTEVTANYDPLLGKVIVHAPTRKKAIATLIDELKKTKVRGVSTNVEAVIQVCESEKFISGNYGTKYFESLNLKSTAVEIISSGLQSSLQDYPGRVGYWSIGVSPSGAMDSYAMNIANALVGNPIGATALEMTVTGATLKFHTDAVVALSGARFQGEYDDGRPVPWWTPFRVPAGSILELGTVSNEVDDPADEVDSRYKKRPGGKLAYLAIKGGFDAPKYLGSTATFPNAKIGGEHGRFLEAGDFLALKQEHEKSGMKRGWQIEKVLTEELIPSYTHESLEIGAINGPHGSQDFFHKESLAKMWTEFYKVHHAANRLGVRLQGPTPKWTRTDGGSAGMHPSNLHDYTYAPGAVNYSGNTPIVLMLDGPSLGGFVCPFTVATAEVWKVSQATAGTNVKFKQICYNDAREAVKSMRNVWEAVRSGNSRRCQQLAKSWIPSWVTEKTSVDKESIIQSLDSSDGTEMKVTYRMSGDEHILVEYGDIELDLTYRMRVHMLMEAIDAQNWVKELCPGVRSVLIRYDADKIHVDELISKLSKIELGLGSVQNISVPSRIVKLPLAFDCRWTKEALAKYQKSVRSTAPYLPSNVEFTRRMNGLDSVEDVKNIMLQAEYCVMGLGDVYLGAPCAVPIDPRHRLITTKMAPARLFTHEGTVGIGGAYMCIYGMDSPGGYQLMGRTIPIWDSYGSVPESHRGAPPEKPWLLRFFDRVSYYPVTDDELEVLRAQYKRGQLKLEIEEGEFSYSKHKEFLQENEETITQFQELQSKAFEEERKRWEEQGETEEDAAAKHAAAQAENTEVKEEKPLQMYAVRVKSGFAATVFEILINDGDVVEAGQSIFSLESMKVELKVEALVSGVVKNIGVSNGDLTHAETTLCEIHSTKEFAFGDMTLGHLRKMYKIGVLDLESAVGDMKAECTDDLEKDDLTEDLKKLQKLIGRKYLPLFGSSFVVPSQRDDSLEEIIEDLKSTGAVLIGKAQNFEKTMELLKDKKICFAIWEKLAEDSPALSFPSMPLSSKYSVFAHTSEDATIVSEAIGQTPKPASSSRTCTLG